MKEEKKKAVRGRVRQGGKKKRLKVANYVGWPDTEKRKGRGGGTARHERRERRKSGGGKTRFQKNWK